MKWADFGLSKPVNERGTYTMSGIKGSDTWMAPEMLRMVELEEGEIRQRGTIKSDIFSEGHVNCQSNEGWNPLHDLCKNYGNKIIKTNVIQLLIENGIDFNCKNNGGWNALHILCKNCRRKI